MKGNNIFNLIGLINASKNLILGYENVYNSIKKNKINCILISSSISFGSSKKIQDKAKFYNIPVFILDESNRKISDILKKNNIKIMGVKDHGFTKIIMKLAQGE